MDLWNLAIVPLVMLLWSLVVKYHPKLASLPNALIPYFNLVLGLLGQLVHPAPANAGFLTALGSGFSLLWPPIQTVIAAQVYERWVRPVIEHFGIGKALPTGGHAEVAR